MDARAKVECLRTIHGSAQAAARDLQQGMALAPSAASLLLQQARQTSTQRWSAPVAWGTSSHASMVAELAVHRAAERTPSELELSVSKAGADAEAFCMNVNVGVGEAELQTAIDGVVSALSAAEGERGRDSWEDAAVAAIEWLGPAWRDGGSVFAQMRCATQWHPNTCGYHALFNALRCLALDEAQLQSCLVSSSGSSSDEPMADAEDGAGAQEGQRRVWQYIGECFLKLVGTGRWSVESLRSGILDVTHVTELIASDDRLRGRVTVVDSTSANSALEVVTATRGTERHAVLFGARHHWLAVAIFPGSADSGGAESRATMCVVLDSDNKDWRAVLDPQSGGGGGGGDSSAGPEAALSRFLDQQMEHWRSQSRERKIRANPDLAHHPASVLDAQFDAGVPEYWKGKEKDKCWWRRKPLAMMRSMLGLEVASVRGLARLLAGASVAEQTDADDLWFGSKRCRLVTAPGAFHADRGWDVDRSPSALKATLSRTEPLVAQGQKEGELPVVVPCIPSLALVARDGDGGDENVAECPAALAAPLRKAALSPDVFADAGGAFEDSGLHAVASGVRSALARVPVAGTGGGDKWYRLKGCGNGDAPFETRTGPCGTWQELRGCAFHDTAARELYMTTHLACKSGAEASHDSAQALSTAVCANKSVGMWLYGSALLNPFGESDLFRACCCVEETLGDRRLGTHVLAGVDLLLPLLSEVEDLGALQARFPKARPDPTTVATAELMTDAMLAFELAPGAHGLTWDVPRDEALFGTARHNGARLGFRDRAPTPASLASVRQWEQDGPKRFDGKWTQLWAEASGELEAVLNELRLAGREMDSVLGYLFARLGHDAGATLKFMHGRGTSWGTYQDKMCAEGQFHCNSHSNNFCMLSPAAAAAAGTHSLLAFTDLDMAFTEHDFVDVRSGDVGHTGFDSLFKRERINLAEVLAQADSTSGLPTVALGVVESYDKSTTALRSLLYDTLLNAYLDAYDRDHTPERVTFDPLLHRGAYAIVQLAIIVMADCVA